MHEEREYTDPEEIGNVFNSFFTNLSSTSLSSESDCDSYIDKTFSRLKRENKIKLKSGSFKFVRTNENIVERLIMNLNSASGPGISDIPSKVIKSACITLVPVLTSLFNHCIDLDKFPVEWKSAIAIPL